jgi:homoserine dehydrogenase
VIGHIGSCFGAEQVSLQSIVQFESDQAGAEIVVITHSVEEGRFRRALAAILAQPEVEAISCCLRTL